MSNYLNKSFKMHFSIPDKILIQTKLHANEREVKVKSKDFAVKRVIKFGSWEKLNFHVVEYRVILDWGHHV